MIGHRVAFATRCLGVGWCVAALLLARPQAATAPTGLDAPIVVTQLPLQSSTPTATRDAKSRVSADGFEGARLVVVSPKGQVRLLSEGFHSACDPNVSFDGHRVLFAGKREATSRWRIWEMGLDGQDLRAVTPENLDARSPIHVSTLFTLDSPEPWFTTVFVGREPALNEAGQPSASSLYNLKLDGTELRRLTFNPNPNLDPFQMWDGRVLYAAERHPNQPGASAPHVGLYTIHLEGADMEFYGGEQARRFQRMPCSTDGGLTVFVESDQPAADGAGQLGCVEQQRPHLTYRPLTSDPAVVYLYPSPLQGGRLLVARRPAKGNGTWGIFGFNTALGSAEPVFDSPEYHDIQAVLAAPRRRPDGHSTVVDTKFDSGIFYGLNCYDAEARMAPHVRTGMVKKVRFIEGIPALPTQVSNTPSGPGSFVARRLVGEAPVEADGSFNVEVPADIPLLLQTLDERGMALAQCGWIWVKPKEKRGCIGCHEDPERIPENEYVLALRRPSNRLVLPPADRRAVSFRQDIAPILQQHCATRECHGGKKSALRLPLTAEQPTEKDLQAAYSALLAPASGRSARPPATSSKGKYVDAGRARTSWLLWQLSGQDTSRPWDREHASTGLKRPKISPMPPPGTGEPLGEQDLQTIIQWVDSGAQYAAPAPPQDSKHTSTP